MIRIKKIDMANPIINSTRRNPFLTLMHKLLWKSNSFALKSYVDYNDKLEIDAINRLHLTS